MPTGASIPLKEGRNSIHEGFYRLNVLDILLIGIILVGASGVLLFTRLGLNWGGASSRSEAAVFLAGRPIHRMNLQQDGEWSLLEGGMVIEVQDRRIRVRKSDCANQICVNSGWIAHPGAVIACVPNQVMIEIKTEKGPFLDAIVQ